MPTCLIVVTMMTPSTRRFSGEIRFSEYAEACARSGMLQTAACELRDTARRLVRESLELRDSARRRS